MYERVLVTTVTLNQVTTVPLHQVTTVPLNQVTTVPLNQFKTINLGIKQLYHTQILRFDGTHHASVEDVFGLLPRHRHRAQSLHSNAAALKVEI